VTGYETYKMYLAVRSHFTRPEYDFFKFNGKVKASESAFQKRKDVYFFKKLATKKDANDMLYYFVSNFIMGAKYIRQFSDGNYAKWQSCQESFTYKFKQDIDTLLNGIEQPYEQTFDQLFHAETGKHPILIREYYANEISLETLVVLDYCLGFVGNFNKVLSDPVWNETSNMIVKYAPFLNIDCKKYKKVVLETMQRKL
jgi:hypothetical protein